MQPLLTVCIITYNHEAYIKQAIDSVLAQKTSFDFKIIVADDCSKDATREILKEYSQDHPGKFQLIFQQKNVGPGNNWLDLINAPTTKYAAYFEGDDYWTDEYKLQKQVDFLEQRPEFVCHTHNAKVLENESVLRTYHDFSEDRVLSADDIVGDLSIPTGSIVYKNCLKPMPAFLMNMPYDIVFYFALAQHGKFYQSRDVMSVYRLHHTGAWNGKNPIQKLNENIKIKEYHLKKMPLTPSQKRKVKQSVMQIKLARLKYNANHNFLKQEYFSDVFYLIQAKLELYHFSMKYFIACLLPDSLVDTVRRK